MGAATKLDRAKLILDLRRRGVRDPRVLKAMEETPRDLFVDQAFAARAYEDQALPIACGQTISQPYVVALMTEALDIGERDKVFEVGAGSGYQTAILAKLCRRVYAMERHHDLYEGAQRRLEALGITNVTFLAGDGTKGWAAQAPFDAILSAAAGPSLPKAWIDQVKVGGRIVAPIGGREDQHLYKITRTEDGLKRERLAPVRFVPLIEDGA